MLTVKSHNCMYQTRIKATTKIRLDEFIIKIQLSQFIAIYHLGLIQTKILIPIPVPKQAIARAT